MLPTAPMDYLPDQQPIFHGAGVMFLQCHARDHYQDEGLITCPSLNHQTPSKHQEIENDYCLPITYTVSSRSMFEKLLYMSNTDFEHSTLQIDF